MSHCPRRAFPLGFGASGLLISCTVYSMMSEGVCLLFFCPESMLTYRSFKGWAATLLQNAHKSWFFWVYKFTSHRQNLFSLPSFQTCTTRCRCLYPTLLGLTHPKSQEPSQPNMVNPGLPYAIGFIGGCGLALKVWYDRSPAASIRTYAPRFCPWST